MAIAIPVFNQQLEKSREATDMSNIRAAYAEVVSDYLANGAKSSFVASVTARQTQPSWQNPENGKLWTRVEGEEKSVKVSALTSGDTYQVKISKGGTVSVDKKP